jgi:hypothetical protein
VPSNPLLKLYLYTSRRRCHELFWGILGVARAGGRFLGDEESEDVGAEVLFQGLSGSGGERLERCFLNPTFCNR